MSSTPDPALGVDELLGTTRSLRRRLDLDAAVDLDVVDECLRLAMQTPNGSNAQRWRWIVVSAPELRAEIAAIVTDAYHQLTGTSPDDGPRPAAPPELLDDMTPAARIGVSSRWLVEVMADVPVHVIPCVARYQTPGPGLEQFHEATLWGSIFPAVWNFQLALRSRGYGTCLTTLHLVGHDRMAELLGIPPEFRQACLLPVARIRGANRFRPAPRLPLAEVVGRDGWS
ncbi:MAG: nitroreductase family protein [Acidimicrobiia bacterium]